MNRTEQNLLSLASVGDSHCGTHTHTNTHEGSLSSICQQWKHCDSWPFRSWQQLPFCPYRGQKRKAGRGVEGWGAAKWTAESVEDIAKQKQEESFGRELNKFPLPFPIFHLCHFCHFCNSSFVFEPKVVCGGGRCESSRSRGSGLEGGKRKEKAAQTFAKRTEALRRHRHHICPGRGSGSIWNCIKSLCLVCAQKDFN